MAAVFPWYSSNTHTEYPFASRQADGLHRLFVDAYILHNQQRANPGLPRLAIFDPAGTCELRFADGSLLATLTVADNFAATAFGSYTIYRWLRQTTAGPGFTDVDLSVKLVVLTSKLPDFSYPYASATAFFTASVVNPGTEEVRRAGVALPGIACCTGGGITEKQVILEAGFNVELRQAQTPTSEGVLNIISGKTTRVPTVVEVAAIPGSGLGRFPTCVTLESDIKKVNDVGPDDAGNLSLQGEGCTWVERRIENLAPPVHPDTDYSADPIPALLQLHQNCKACCDCEEYAAAYEALSRIWARALAVAKRIEKMRLLYISMREQLLAFKAANENGINVRLRLIARPDFHVAASALIFNNSPTIIGPVNLKLVFDPTDIVFTQGSGLLDAEGYRGIPFDPIVTTGQLEVTLPPIESTRYSVYSAEVRFGPGFTTRVDRAVNVKAFVSVPGDNALDVSSIKLTKPLEKA